MEKDYQQTQHVRKLKGDAIYNYYEAPPTPTTPPRKPFRWGWAGGIAAVLALGGTLATSHLNAQTVYYCASHHSGVKYHTDATCLGLTQCSARESEVDATWSS